MRGCWPGAGWTEKCLFCLPSEDHLPPGRCFWGPLPFEEAGPREEKCHEGSVAGISRFTERQGWGEAQDRRQGTGSCGGLWGSWWTWGFLFSNSCSTMNAGPCQGRVHRNVKITVWDSACDFVSYLPLLWYTTASFQGQILPVLIMMQQKTWTAQVFGIVTSPKMYVCLTGSINCTIPPLEGLKHPLQSFQRKVDMLSRA